MNIQVVGKKTLCPIPGETCQRTLAGLLLIPLKEVVGNSKAKETTMSISDVEFDEVESVSELSSYKKSGRTKNPKIFFTALHQRASPSPRSRIQSTSSPAHSSEQALAWLGENLAGLGRSETVSTQLAHELLRP